MRDIYIIPRGRDKQAKEFYKFADWYFRKTRKEHRVEFGKIMDDLMLYGTAYSKDGEHIPFKDTGEGAE